MICTGVPKEKNIVSQSDVNEVASYASKVAGIKEVLCRDHMKVSKYSCVYWWE